MQIRDFLDIFLALLTLLSSGGYVLTEARRRKEQAEARGSEWNVWKGQLDWALGEIKELRGQLEGLEERQGETVAHLDDLYSAIGAQPEAVQTAIKDRLTTPRPGARFKHKTKPETQPAAGGIA